MVSRMNQQVAGGRTPVPLVTTVPYAVPLRTPELYGCMIGQLGWRDGGPPRPVTAWFQFQSFLGTYAGKSRNVC